MAQSRAIRATAARGRWLEPGRRPGSRPRAADRLDQFLFYRDQPRSDQYAPAGRGRGSNIGTTTPRASLPSAFHTRVSAGNSSLRVIASTLPAISLTALLLSGFQANTPAAPYHTAGVAASRRRSGHIV